MMEKIPVRPDVFGGDIFSMENIIAEKVNEIIDHINEREEHERAVEEHRIKQALGLCDRRCE